MKRTALAPLAAGLVLAAASIVVAYADAPGSAGSSRSVLAAAANTRATSATVDTTTPDAAFVATTRDAGTSRSSPTRSFAATLAALVALVAFAAARAARSLAHRNRATAQAFDVRRRGPPLLHPC